MSYTQVNGKPDCFADSDEYNERSTTCKACSHRVNCEKDILSGINNYIIRDQKMTSNSSWGQTQTWGSTPTPNVSPEQRRRSPITHTQVQDAGNQPLRPVKFNHNKSLAKQLGAHVAYDTADAILTRSKQLVASMRAEYERDILSDD
jgi:hypothetical protein